MTEASTAREPAVAARIDEARRLADSGRILEAEQAFLAILRDAPRETDALNFVAICAHERGRYAQALALLERARGVRADDPVTLTNLGVTHAALGRLDQAIEALRAALKLAPDLSVARLRLGEVWSARAARTMRWRSTSARSTRRKARASGSATTPPRRAFARSCCMRCAPSRPGGGGLFASLLQPLRERHGAAALARVEKCLAVYLTELPANYSGS